MVFEEVKQEKNSASNILGPPIGYVDMLDIAINKKNLEDAAKPPSKSPFRPSSAGKCAREKAYEYAEFKGYAKFERELMTPEGFRIFSLGHAVEYDLLKNFYLLEGFHQRYKQQVLSFYTMPDGTLLEGSLDAVLWSEKHRCIIDVKSKKDKWSNYYTSNWDETSEKLSRMKTVTTVTDTTFYADDLEAFLEELNDPFFRSNFVQLNMYACNPFITERNIDHAAIIQYNKNDSRLREIRFKPSQALFKLQEEIDITVASIVDTTKDPANVAKDYVLGSVKCAFCSFKSECWKESDALKDYFKTLPGKRWPKDTDRLAAKVGQELETLFEKRAELANSAAELKKLDTQILLVLQEAKLSKIRLPNKEVYEVKYLKGGHEIRRSKT